MKEKLLHTPEGVRDIYNSECKKKTALEQRLHRVLALYGYQDIETPTFEFFDIFNSDTGTVSSRDMFKFFDRDNNTLVLRPDMTPSIARSVAKYYSDCTFPLRLSYTGNNFLNNRSYQGKLTEKTELGAEHINDDSPEADAEAVVMMIDCFLEAGLKDFRIDIGQSEFYRGIMDSLDVTKEEKAQIHDYIENKNALGMEMLLGTLSMKDCYRNILLEYNELYGDVLNSPEYWAYGEWMQGEPSFQDGDIAEDCMDFYYYENENRWTWNDVPNDIISVVPYFSGKIGYIVEYED